MAVNREELRLLCQKLNLFHLSKIKTFDIDINDKLEYLKFLLEYEIDERRKSVRNKNIAASHIPCIDKEFEYTGIDKWNIEDLKKSNFIEKGQSIIIVGKCGKGKTKLASDIGIGAIDKGYKVIYLKQEELLKILKEKEYDSKQKNMFQKLKDADAIIIDEMMYLPIEKEDVLVLYKGLMYLKSSRSLIIVTNRKLNEWKTINDDKHTMETLVDRLITDSRIISLK